MSVRSAQAITVEFITSNPTTQAAVNADSLPAGTLVVNGVDNAAVVTVTNITTGRYKAAVTLPTLAIGDIVELAISATVSAVAGKAIVYRDTKDVALDTAGGVTLADGVAHGGTPGSSTATLALKNLAIVASGFDDAVDIFGGGAALNISSGNNTDCILINSAGAGIVVSAGTNAVNLGSPDVAVLVTSAGTASVVQLGDGISGGSGLTIYGHAFHPAVAIGGGTNAGAGILIVGGNGNPDAAVQLGDGVNGAGGLKILPGPDTTGVEITTTGSTASGVQINATGTASAIDLESPGGTGININSSQDGITIFSANGAAISGTGAGTYGLNFAGNGVLPDFNLGGSGLFQADLGGRILGNTATAFAGIGVQVASGGGGVDVISVNGVTFAGASVPAVLAAIQPNYAPSKAGDAMTLTVGERNAVADALLDRANGVETGLTPRQALRLEIAALVGKLSGAGSTTITIRDINDTVDRIVATVDSFGDRTHVVTNTV